MGRLANMSLRDTWFKKHFYFNGLYRGDINERSTKSDSSSEV